MDDIIFICFVLLDDFINCDIDYDYFDSEDSEDVIVLRDWRVLIFYFFKEELEDKCIILFER